MLRDIVFLIIALLLLALWGLPNFKVVLTLLFSRKVTCDFDDSSTTIDIDEFPQETQDLHRKIMDLGFRPLGIKRERRPLQETREIAYASEPEKSFAAVHSLESDCPHVYFYTPYADGAVVLTSDVVAVPVHQNGFVRTGYPGRNAAELLEQHRKHVQKMSGKGHLPYTQFDRESRLRATYAYYEHAGTDKLQNHIFWRALGNAGTSIGLALLATLLVVWRFL